jgi:hypothetical protein
MQYAPQHKQCMHVSWCIMKRVMVHHEATCDVGVKAQTNANECMSRCSMWCMCVTERYTNKDHASTSCVAANNVMLTFALTCTVGANMGSVEGPKLIPNPPYGFGWGLVVLAPLGGADMCIKEAGVAYRSIAHNVVNACWHMQTCMQTE